MTSLPLSAAGSRTIRHRRSLLVFLVVLAVTALLVGPAASPALAQTPDGGGDLVEYEVVDRYGISVHEYSIEGRQGGGVDGGFKRLGIWLSDVLFSASRMIVVGLVWLLNFALEFGLADLMLTQVEQLIDVYESNFVGTVSGGGWGLVPLALMICVFWFGLAALRGRVGKGVGEITLSFVLAVVLGAVLANPGGFLLGDEGLVGRARDIGSDVAVTAVRPTGSGDPPACIQNPVQGQGLVDGCYVDPTGDGVPPTRDDPQYLRWIMQMWLVDMYVRRPHQHMAYGQRLDCPLVLQVRGSEENPDASACAQPYEDGGNHACVDQYNLILLTNPATAPEAAGANPESYMYDMMHPDEPVEGCAEGEELAAYLDRGTGDRVVVGALLLFTLLILGAFLLIGVILPLVIGQLMVAILAVALIFVLPLALLGGGGRRVLWKWFGMLLAAVFMMVVSLVGLALMLITTELLLRGHHQFFFINLLLITVSSVLFLFLQRRMLKGAVAGGGAVGGALSRMRIGGSGGGGGGADGWTRAATVGYAPIDRWKTNRTTRQNVYRSSRYAKRWAKRNS